MRPRLSPYRRYELRKGLQEAAKARGEPMTKVDADYCIDKALANGVLDSAGDLNFVARGNRDRLDRLLDRKRLGTIGCGRSWP
jgi:hypothetical protein